MELIVKINSNPGDASYKDGDVVQAFSNSQIQFCHAENICNVKNFGLDPVTGLRVNDSLLMKFLEKTNLYKFERVNSNEVVRTNLISNVQDTLSKDANPNGERIDAHEYISRRLRSPSHKVFGSAGSEIWYSKPRSIEEIDLDSIWDDIETDSSNLKSNHLSWEFTELEKKHFACINTSGRAYEGDSFTRVELSGDTVHTRALPAIQDPPEVIPEDYSPIILAKRKWFVPYWDLTSQLGSSVDDLRNPNISCDCRKELDEREHIDILTFDKVSEGII
tara:strand:+ start:217 stop:1047 length:831 start_codon:yes stop_codon:yes gene_type:complete